MIKPTRFYSSKQKKAVAKKVGGKQKEWAEKNIPKDVIEAKMKEV